MVKDLGSEDKEPEPLLVTKFEKKGPEAEVMFFTGKREEADDIIRWLRSHGIPASYQDAIDTSIRYEYEERPRHILTKPTIAIANGHDGRNAVFIAAPPESAIIHWDGDRALIDVMPMRHFQNDFRVCQEIDHAAGIIQVEVK